MGFDMRKLMFLICDASAWFLSLGRNFFRVAPLLTAAAVGFTIASQLFLLVGFLLPLKVVLLLGSETIPHYFPAFMAEFGKERLVILLSLASVLFYFAHLACDALVTRFSERGAGVLVLRSRKMILFERQDEIASKGYLRFSQALAGICFTGVCLLGMLAFYAKLVLLIVGYFVSFTCCSMALCMLSSSFRGSLEDGLGYLPKLMASLGFLSTFSFIVVDFLYFEPVGVLVAVIGLLLSRQLFNKSANVLKDVAELFMQREMLRALYFHAHVFRPVTKENGFSGVAESKTRNQWMLACLSTVMEVKEDKIACRWMSMGTPELLCFLADVVTVDGTEKQILFKVFDSRRRSQALHEATLLAQQQGLRAPPLIGATVVAGMNCHFFDVTRYKLAMPDVNDSWQAKVEAFRMHALALSPSPTLVSSYLRSRAHLPRRLEVMSTDYIRQLYEGQCDLGALTEFQMRLPDIARLIASFTLAIHVLDIRPGMLWVDAEDNLYLSHWGRWELEPIGFKWSHDLTMLESSLALLRKQNQSEEGELGVHQVRLVALCSSYEDYCRKARYDSALDIVPSILSEYAACVRGEV